MKDRVLEEIDQMVKEKHGTDKADKEQIFSLRTTAAKNVFLRLSADEQAAIERRAKAGGDPVPIEIQQQ